MVSRFVGRRVAKPAPIPEVEAPLVSASSPSGPRQLLEGKHKVPRCHVEVATHTAKNWGGRHENEDRCMASDDVLTEHLSFHTVGVLDGHDTDSASDLVAKLLPGAVGRRIKVPPGGKAYMEAMAEMEDRLKREHATAGTCVNSCTIAGGCVWCANLGDCRAALVSLEAAATPGAVKAQALTWLSRDHKASCPIEQKRIEAVGGTVIEGRVEGLEPSRTLGDFDVKMTVKPGVISIVPEVRCVDLAAGATAHSRGAILMCATDGIWDVMTGQDLCKIMQARKELSSFLVPEAVVQVPKAGVQALHELAEDIVQFALAKGSRDDCTCLVAMITVSPE
ncbi:Protein phosphatase 1A (Protein phosphatase 2C isoform alpha) (PP2C-alpha) [Durusdinium trenchii]|uniref:Protein phosphatase 1A (Protein phosphatase 2C isoform alpha) (PP2C-alpha) n=1 Tax=Durusdinium trenchii TaxID=1381693 RepID=A0ABP0HGM3_9DINO